MNATNKNTPDNNQSGFLKKTAVTLGALGIMGFSGDNVNAKTPNIIPEAQNGISEKTNHILNPIELKDYTAKFAQALVGEGIKGSSTNERSKLILEMGKIPLLNVGEITNKLNNINNDSLTLDEDKVFINSILNEINNGKKEISLDLKSLTYSQKHILSNLGIKIDGYNGDYEKFLDGLMETVKTAKNEKLKGRRIVLCKEDIQKFNGLNKSSQDRVLSIINAGLSTGELSSKDKAMLSSDPITLELTISNFDTYLETGELKDENYLTLPSYLVKALIELAPGTKSILTENYIKQRQITDKEVVKKAIEDKAQAELQLKELKNKTANMKKTTTDMEKTTADMKKTTKGIKALIAFVDSLK